MMKKSLTTTRALLLLAISTPVIAQYQPVAPTGDPAAAPAPNSVDNRHIDPQNGRSPEQQWSDRYACQNWAATQSGFDPTKRASGSSVDTSRRGDYLRAFTACLEGRGYSVRDAAPPPYTAPVPAAAPPTYTPPVPATPPSGWTSIEHTSPRLSEPKYHPLVLQIDAGYSLTTGATHQDLENGSNVGVGITWFPSSVLRTRGPDQFLHRGALSAHRSRQPQVGLRAHQGGFAFLTQLSKLGDSGGQRSPVRMRLPGDAGVRTVVEYRRKYARPGAPVIAAPSKTPMLAALLFRDSLLSRRIHCRHLRCAPHPGTGNAVRRPARDHWLAA